MMLKRFLACLILSTGALFAQITTLPGGGGGTGVGAPNVTATCAGTVTTCAVTITSLGLTAATQGTALVQCFVSSTGAALTITALSFTGGPPLTTATPTFTSTTGVYCTVNSNGGAGATGATGAQGPPGAGNNTYCADATGSTTTYTCPNPAIPVTTRTGLIATFVPQSTNTGASTLKVGTLATTTLKQSNCSTDVLSGTLVAGTAYLFSYNGSVFCQSAGAGSGSGTVTVVGGGNLTSTDLVTGGGSQTVQTPSNLATLDSSGNLVSNSLTTGSTGTAGNLALNNAAGTATANISGASVTTTNTMQVFAAPPTTGHLVDVTVSGTIETLHDSGVVTATVTKTVASGTSALGTSAIASGACATVVTTSATGTLTTDAISWTPNASIKAVTGYVPSTSGGLSIVGYPTADNVNWDVCNWSAGSITPGAVTLNWRVVR